MSDHPSELRQVPTAEEIKAGQVQQFREAMAEAMAEVDPRQAEAAAFMAGLNSTQGQRVE